MSYGFCVTLITNRHRNRMKCNMYPLPLVLKQNVSFCIFLLHSCFFQGHSDTSERKYTIVSISLVKLFLIFEGVNTLAVEIFTKSLVFEIIIWSYFILTYEIGTIF